MSDDKPVQLALEIHVMSDDKLVQMALEIHILGAVAAKRTMQAVEGHPALADASISMLQYGIVRALSCRQQTISELSQQMMVDPSTLVPAVDALERKDLARRGHDPKDRRRTPLSLTKKGARMVSGPPCDNPFASEDNPLLNSLRAMGDDRSQQLLTLLRELVSHLPKGEEILQKVSARVRMHSAIESAR